MAPFLVHFAQFHVNFRLPELESLAQLENIPIEFDRTQYSDNSAFLVVHLPNVDAAQRLIARAILIKDIIELWAEADTIEALHEAVRACQQRHRPQYKTCRFRFMVEGVGKSITMPEQISRIEKFVWLGFKGPIDLKNYDAAFVLFEDYGISTGKDMPIPENPLRLFFGLWIAKGNRTAVAKYDLKKREYLGTTSMDAELSLVMANQALVRPGSLVIDPFVGTGSFLVSCSHFGAYTIGSDIDGRQIRGNGEKNVYANVAQYQLESRVLGTLVYDMAHHPWRDCEIWDAIVCDPPYGVRAGAKTIASNQTRETPVSAFKANGEPRYPNTMAYEMESVISDLISFAARYLVVGGRLVFWLPTFNEQYKPQDIPTSPFLRLISNSEQSFGRWSRRLITMEKTVSVNQHHLDTASQPVIDAVSADRVNEPGHARFREKYFGPNDVNGRSTPSS